MVIIASGPGPTPPAVAPRLTSVVTLRSRLVRETWPGARPLVSATTGLGLTSTVVVGTEAYSSGDANAYDAVYVYIAELVTGGPAIGEYSRVTRAGYAASTGTFTVSPVFTNAVQSGTDVHFLYGLHPDEFLDAINWIQTSLDMPAYLLLTLVTDGDMEDSTMDNWAAVGSPTTREKVTTASRVLIGQRAAHFVSDALSEGIRSNAIDVHDTEVLPFSIPVMCVSGSASAELCNQADDSVIRTVTVDERAYAEVRFEEPVPDGVRQVYVRVISQTAVSDVYVGWGGLLSDRRMIYDLPSQVTDATKVEEVVYLPYGDPSEASDAWIALSKPLQPWPSENILRDWRAANPQRIEVGRPSGYPLFLKFRRVGPSLSADTDNTEIPENLIVKGALSKIRKVQAGQTSDREREIAFLQESAMLNDAYRVMLDSLDLARPVIQSHGMRRVPVSG